jgi:DNA polymerase III epsilon subunit-like protein
MFTIIYDFETSGLNPYHDDIIEIGCKCIEIDESFTCLVQPLSDRLIDDKITEITGITNQLLKQKGLVPKTAFIQFFEFLQNIFYRLEGDMVVVAHNGQGFDDIFLKRIHRYLLGEEISDYDTMMNHLCFIDSLALCKYLYPSRCSYSMKAMCHLFNIDNISEHRAMGDVDALALLWAELVKKCVSNSLEVSGSNLRYITYCE